MVEHLASRHGAEFRRERFWNCVRARCRPGDEELTLIKPLSYVNLSGPVVRKVSEDLSVESRDILIVLDDFWLPLGRLRLRGTGGGGGHRGLESILRAVGTGCPRMRIGIGTPDPEGAVDHVLSRFRSEEREVMDRAIQRAADAVELWAFRGLETAMNTYNPEEE